MTFQNDVKQHFRWYSMPSNSNPASASHMCLKLMAFLLPALLGSGIDWVGDWKDHEYSFVSHEQGQSWYEADGFCMQNGGDLLYLDSKEEQRKLSYHWRVDADSCYWTGLNDLTRNGIYTWSNGQDYTLEDTPKATGRFRRRLCYCATKSSFDLDPTDCRRIMAFICKRKKGDTVPKTRPPVKVAGYCPDGWRDAGTNKCYRAFNDRVWIGWMTAVDRCYRMPGYKANIACATTQAEVDALTQLVSSCPKGAKFWFGLRREDNYTRINRTKNFLHKFTYIRAYEDNSRCSLGYLEDGAIPPGSEDLAQSMAILRSSLFICQIEKDPYHVITTKPRSDGGDEVCLPTGGSSGTLVPPATGLIVVMCLVFLDTWNLWV